MPAFEIVAHRGAPGPAPENTLPAFERAIALQADFVEFDVRLTADQVPVVFHNTYLDETTSTRGPIFQHTYQQIRELAFFDREHKALGQFRISKLAEVLQSLAGRIGLEIEVKGPEPEATALIAATLLDFRSYWDQIEVTSYEPAHLIDIHKRCPGLATDLLYPRSQAWMKLDVVAYEARQRTRLARARGVHLHPSQLTVEVVSQIRSAGLAVHAWQIESEADLQLMVDLGIPRFSTENLLQALAFREKWIGDS